MLRRPILDRLRAQPLPPRGTGRILGTARPWPSLSEEERRARHYGSTVCQPCGILGGLFFGQVPQKVEVYRGVQVWSISSMGETSYYCDLSPLWFDTVREVELFIDKQLGEQEYVSTLSITIVNPQYGTVTMQNAPHAEQIEPDLYGFTAADNIRVVITPKSDYVVGNVYLDGGSRSVPDTGGTLNVLMTTSHYLVINFGTETTRPPPDFIENYRGYEIWLSHDDPYVDWYQAYLRGEMVKRSSTLGLLEDWIDDQLGGGNGEVPPTTGLPGDEAPGLSAYEAVIPLIERTLLEASQIQTAASRELRPLYVNEDCISAIIRYQIKFVRGASLATYVYTTLKVDDVEVERRIVNKSEEITGYVDITRDLESKIMIEYGFESAAGLWEQLEFTMDIVLGFADDPGWSGGFCPFPKLRPGLLTSGDAPVLCSLWHTTVSTLPMIQKIPMGPIRSAWNNIELDINIGKAIQEIT